MDKVSTILTIVKKASTLDGPEALLWAKKDADQEFNHYFVKIYPYITRIDTVIMKEIFALEGYTGYMIRVHLTAPVEDVKRLHTEAGVKVDVEVKAGVI